MDTALLAFDRVCLVTMRVLVWLAAAIDGIRRRLPRRVRRWRFNAGRK